MSPMGAEVVDINKAVESIAGVVALAPTPAATTEPRRTNDRAPASTEKPQLEESHA